MTLAERSKVSFVFLALLRGIVTLIKTYLVRVMPLASKALPPVIMFTDRSKAVLLLWAFLLLIFHVCVMLSCLFLAAL